MCVCVCVLKRMLRWKEWKRDSDRRPNVIAWLNRYCCLCLLCRFVRQYHYFDFAVRYFVCLFHRYEFCKKNTLYREFYFNLNQTISWPIRQSNPTIKHSVQPMQKPHKRKSFLWQRKMHLFKWIVLKWTQMNAVEADILRDCSHTVR